MAVTDRHKSQLAEYLGVSKGYVSQLLNGDYDHCMSKFFELALAFGMVRKEKRIVPIVSIVFKKNKRAKNNPLVLLFIFCFLRFLYNRLFPIRLVFSNCIFYIVFSQLSFSRLYLFSSRKLSYKEDGTCCAFLYDVDKGAGGVKLYMLWLFRGQRLAARAAARRIA